MNLFHPKKGILVHSKKTYSNIGNKNVDIYEDENGKEHQLDGTEEPLENVLKRNDEIIAKKKENRAKMGKEQEDMLKEAENSIKEAEEDAKEKALEEERHNQVLESIDEVGDEIVGAIQSIPKTVIPEYPDHIEEQRKWKDAILKALKIKIPEVDLSPVIEAIHEIHIPESPKQKDYTDLLVSIKNALPKEVDMSGVIQAIQNIPEEEPIPFKFTKEGRLKVAVDMVSAGGGGIVDTTKLVTFDASANMTTTIVTVGSIKTITETDGVKTLTTTIDATDVDNKTITSIWS